VIIIDQDSLSDERMLFSTNFLEIAQDLHEICDSGRIKLKNGESVQLNYFTMSKKMNSLLLMDMINAETEGNQIIKDRLQFDK